MHLLVSKVVKLEKPRERTLLYKVCMCRNSCNNRRVSDLVVPVEQDELAVCQDAELPLPGSTVGVRTLTAGEPVSRRTFDIWEQTQEDTLEYTGRIYTEDM